VLKGTRGGDVIVALGGKGKDALVGGPGTDACTGGAKRDSASTCERRRSI
jgi:Ca2+-binding RTX toxin-like protein